VEGPRLPDVYHSQKKFNTGMVVVVEHGKRPSKELIERANAIRDRWIDYFAGHHRAPCLHDRESAVICNRLRL
jgi:hypothetical protein